MKLSWSEMIVILTWIPTAVSYLIEDIKAALIFLVSNIAGMIVYVYRDAIRSNRKIMDFLRKIF
ncbi:MAG: hypothetical protein PHV10_04340 [Sulfuricurvum sp.]|nr:hypothetical protein [Sulfuricurvum sp.]